MDCWVFLIAAQVFLLPIVHCKTHVSVQLISYQNPRSKDYAGDCCDNLGSLWCFSECDNWFIMCFTSIPIQSGKSCIANIRTYILGDDSFTFPGYGKTIGKNLRNPIEFVYDGSFTGLGLQGEVWDDDGGNFLGIGRADDKVDIYSRNLQISPSKLQSEIRPLNVYIPGRRSNLQLLIRAYCVKDWYGKDCNTYCVPVDGVNGHYKCDPDTGTKKCLGGWSGPSCKQATCSPKCDTSHANCTTPGDCTCINGWQDSAPKTCDTCIKKVGCVNGYCLHGNDCLCDLNWLGELCDIHNNTCHSSPCQNSAPCKNSAPGKFTCHCQPGYFGKTCAEEVDACQDNPCQQGSVCVNKRTDYYCPCPTGYEGKNCSINTDDCTPLSCQNGGKCQDGINSFTCVCATGYTGPTCNINFDECANNSCTNDATCVDGVGSYNCSCRDGFTGAFCEVDINDCQSSPCLHGGNCTDKLNNFQCDCVVGWIGRTCSGDNKCATKPCGKNGNCTDIHNGYNCTCHAGFTGMNCEINVDECTGTNCNQGICIDGINSYNCRCKSGFSGKNCEINIDDCASSPCSNNATCNDDVDDYNCACLAGWTGKKCEVDINDCVVECDSSVTSSEACVETPCHNGAQCVDEINSFKCVCQTGFEGQLCNKQVDYCAIGGCLNGAQCVNKLDGYVCVCKAGYMGRNCSVDINECSSSPCSTNGSKACLDRVNKFHCNCKKGYTGVLCDQSIDDCDPRNYLTIPEGQDITSWGFCGRHGQCVDGINRYTCDCDVGYTGRDCQTDLDECATNPCNNNATCFEKTYEAGFYCVCAQGYNGTHCEIDIDECVSADCCKDSICVDHVNGYTCNCTNGMKGIDCCSANSWCENNNTCSKNGECKERSNDFECECLSGYRGKRCEIDIDECLSNPCKGGATCLNLSGNYTCHCPPGKTGADCTQDIDDCAVLNITCANGFKCIDGFESFKCDCPSKGYEQPLCEDIDECASESLFSCPRDRRCLNAIGGYECGCLEGYTGANCRTSIDDCVSINCVTSHTLNCLDGHLSYTCSCFGQWQGERCERRNTSIRDPCGCSHGVCVKDERDVKRCLCDDLFKGTKCTLSTSPVTAKEEDKTFIIVIIVGSISGIVVLIIIITVALAIKRWQYRSQRYKKQISTKSASYHRPSQDVKIYNGELMFANPSFHHGEINDTTRDY